MDAPLHWAQSLREAMLDWYPEGQASLSAPLRQTLLALMVHADPRGVSWMRRSELALFMGVGDEQAKRRLRDLRAVGAVGETVFRRSPEGFRQYGHPILRPPAPAASDPAG